MAAGVRYVAMSPRILNVMARSFVFGAAAISVQALMPLIARDLIQGGPLTFGLLLGAFGVGAIAGAFLGGEMRRRSLSAESCVALAFAGAAACAGGAALSGRPLVTMGCMLVGGASWVLALAGFNAAVQLSSPRWVVGRAVALYQMAAFGGMALGSWAWGIAAEQAGTRNALLGSAVVLALGAALGRVFPVPDVQELDLTPREWKDPEISLDIRPQSGPIIVAIEYRIRAEDEETFMSVMAGRRRIRLRDGARHWTLMRDLADPTTWIERYDCPTWQEYLRQNQRMTQADTDISKALIALHQGPAPIVVRRMIERQTSFPEHAMSREAAQAGS
jgi:MFS family permease